MTHILAVLIGVIFGILIAACFRDNRITRLRDQLADALEGAADAGNWKAAAHINEAATNQWRQRFEDRDRDARNMEQAYIRLDDTLAPTNVVALPAKKRAARKVAAK